MWLTAHFGVLFFPFLHIRRFLNDLIANNLKKKSWKRAPQKVQADATSRPRWSKITSSHLKLHLSHLKVSHSLLSMQLSKNTPRSKKPAGCLAPVPQNNFWKFDDFFICLHVEDWKTTVLNFESYIVATLSAAPPRCHPSSTPARCHPLQPPPPPKLHATTHTSQQLVILCFYYWDTLNHCAEQVSHPTVEWCLYRVVTLSFFHTSCIEKSCKKLQGCKKSCKVAKK